MVAKRRFEVHGKDPVTGDIIIVGADLRQTAEDIAAGFRKKGYRNVRIIQNF